MVILSTAAVGLVVGLVSYFSPFNPVDEVKCRVHECCHTRNGFKPPWIYYDSRLDKLAHELQTQVHGQSQIVKPIVGSLRAHLKRDNPDKALVLSFNGWTGTGKNHVSDIIARNLYRSGRSSRFVKLIIATHHFPTRSLTPGTLEQHRAKLRELIQQETQNCDRNLFIIDEVDKMPSGVIDVIRPYIDYHEKISNVDYRRNIFLLLSNTGGKKLNMLARDMYLAGKRREDYTQADMDQLITLGSFNEHGGLMNSSLIEQNLIDVFVPFLPLERLHVKRCIEDYIDRMDYSIRTHYREKFIDDVADTMSYWPPGGEIFSKSGCKRVSGKVDLQYELYQELNRPQEKRARAEM